MNKSYPTPDRDFVTNIRRQYTKTPDVPEADVSEERRANARMAVERLNLWYGEGKITGNCEDCGEPAVDIVTGQHGYKYVCERCKDDYR